MLTEKQLKAALECPNKGCHRCEFDRNSECTLVENGKDAVAQAALALLDMVKRLEFSNLTWEGQECYICGGKNEHEEGCDLGRMLEEMRCE